MSLEQNRRNGSGWTKYRDPEIEARNLQKSGNINQKHILSPFGFVDELDKDGNLIKKIRFPKAYETRYSSEDNWLEKCYNVIQCSSNRHFWFLLTLKQKYELINFILKFKKDRLYKMAKADYKFIDFYTELVNYQFTEDNEEYVFWILAHKVDEIEMNRNVSYTSYGDDYFILESIKPWKDFIYEEVKDKLSIVDVSDENIYINNGQYIMSFSDTTRLGR